MEKARSIKHECEFCKRTFVKELNLINHSCEKKRRWHQRGEPHATYGFLAWTRFYELNASIGKKKEKLTYREFIDNQFYNAFSKFGRHLRDLNAIEPAKFIDYVIKNNLPIDKWTHDFVYEQYIRELTKKENAEEAFERNVMLMNEWAIQNGEKWTDFFKKINPNQAVTWIKTGRISPWVLYNVDSASILIERCSPEQISIIKEYASPGPWKLKFKKDPDGCNFIRETTRNVGM